MAEEQYLQMLEESLDKKIDVLRQLQFLCEKQTQILQDPNAAPDDLDKNVEEKAKLIERLEGLDNGFETMFARVKNNVDIHRPEHRDAVARMQEKITDIIGRGSRLQVMEQHNKELAKQKFSYVRNQVKEIRQSERAVTSYYQNMMRINTVEPQFMDNKQ